MRRNEIQTDCCFYFFMHNNKPQCTIGSFLLSIAWQMAVMHAEVHKVMQQSLTAWTGEKMGTVDHNPTWRRLFLGGILNVKLNTTQYWILDGLDECKDGPKLVDFLVKIQEFWPVSILITSRDPFNPNTLSQPQTNVICEHLHEEEAKQDIALFVQNHIHVVPARDESDRDEMAQAIVEKSMGCFLWVQLDVSQLKNVHTIADAQNVLASVPSDVNELYSRILDSISHEKHGKHLAKSILRWAGCSSRPLTISKLRAALEIDLEDVIPNVEKAVDACCGHLVYLEVDNQAGTTKESRLRFVHSTAREFLTNNSLASEFVVDKETGHMSLALACLKYLSGGEARPPKHRRLGAEVKDERPPLMDYASTAVFEHVSASGMASVGISAQLAAFLNSPNVLYWVEYLVELSELSRLVQAGMTIGQLLNHGGSATITGVSRDMSTLTSWSTDLVRLVSKFGKQLQSHPHAIHNLIPPFCPQESAVYKRFASSRGIHLVGKPSHTQGWDDCSSIITYAKGETIMATSCSESYFALRTMLSRTIFVYDESTCQEIKRLENGEAIMVLAIGSIGRYLASAGPKSIKVWELASWKLISKIPTPLRCMSLEFMVDDQFLLVAMKNNMLVYWDVANDVCADELRWTLGPDVRETFDARAPVAAVFSRCQGLLAVTYRAYNVLVWNLDREMIHDVYYRESGSRLDAPSAQTRKDTILALTFSAAPGSHALIAGYMDGELVLYDTSQGTLRHRVPGVNAQCLSSSPDGRTLATGDALGTIQLFDLESLKFIYRINFDAQFLFIAVRSLAFTSDGHRLLDVRGKQCRVWKPLALLRQQGNDSGSDALSVSASGHEVDFEGPMEVVYITAVVAIQPANAVLCGKDDGTVHVYDGIKGDHRQELFSLGAAISFLLFDDASNILVCADQSSRVLCSRLIMHPRDDWRTETMFETSAPGAITQVLGNRGLSRVLVGMQDGCVAYSLEKSSMEPTKEIKRENDWTCFSWSRHPKADDLLVLFVNHRAHLYNWATMTPCSPPRSPLTKSKSSEQAGLGNTLRGLMPSVQALRVKMLADSDYFATICEDPRLATNRTQVQLWNNAALDLDNPEAEPHSQFAPLSTAIEHVLGTYRGRLIFLQTDGWICSFSLHFIDAGKTTSHFFIPADWLSLNNQLKIDITASGDVIFIKRSELVIIKRGLELERTPTSSRTSSLARQSGRGSPLRASSIAGASGTKRFSRLSGMAERPHINAASRWKSVS